jgi:hypothetical protein
MPTLREVQAAFRTALLGGDAEPAAQMVAGDGLAPTARLAIYRHHVATTLTEVLAAAFPVVRQLVDPRFFGWAADRYLRTDPPAGPCLLEYGAGFPDFLAGFEPCRHLRYLPDVARLEWSIHAARHAGDAPLLCPRALAAVPAEAAERLRLRMHPSARYLRCGWPADRIWQAHQEGADPGGLRLCEEEVRLEVRRSAEGDVVFRRLGRADFALRRSLAAGCSLGAAAAAAAHADPAFDLSAALAALFGDTVLAGFGIQPVKEARHDPDPHTE